MTEEEQDQLASAYLDGEATPQEVALVERDPALRSRVENFRVVSAQLGSSITVPPGLKERHLAAALAEFDPSQSLSSEEPNTVGESTFGQSTVGESTFGQSTVGESTAGPGDDNVIDFTTRRVESAPTIGDQPMTTVKSRSMPQWLSAAAVSLCVLGGGVWLASQMGSSSDSASFESADAVQETAAMEDDAGADEEAMEDADEAVEEGATDAVAADEAASTTTIVATTEASVDETAAEEEAADGSDAVAEDSPAQDPTEPTSGGFFPNEPVATYRETPDVGDLVEDPPVTPRIDLEQSQCVNEIANAINSPVQVTGYLPIEVGGNPAEFFIFLNENGDESGVVLDADCQPLS